MDGQTETAMIRRKDEFMNRRISLMAHGYEAWIDAGHGGSLIRLARPDLGAESLRTPPADAEPENPFLYGTPPLLPPNRIEGAAFTFRGRRQTMPVNEPSTGCQLHGALHGMPMEVTRQTEDAVSLRFAAKSGEYLNLTYAFEVNLRYQLSGQGIAQEVSITNQGDEPMPAGIGWHTTFQIPFVAGSEPENVRLRLSVGREYLRNMETFLPTWQWVDDSVDRRRLEAGEITPCQETFSRHFRQTAPHRMVLTDIRVGVRIVYDTPQYDFWMLYNGGNSEFVCVEPQSWVINAPHAPWPEQETGLVALKPGETARYAAKISIEKLYKEAR